MGWGEYVANAVKTASQRHPFVRIMNTWFIALLDQKTGAGLTRSEKHEVEELRSEMETLPAFILQDLGKAVQAMMDYDIDPVVGLYHLETGNPISGKCMERPSMDRWEPPTI